MEVTKKNFKETLPLIEKSINSADFLVIDAEFTGLLNGRDASIFDSPKEYYLRLLSGSSEFMLIQYGLCAFYWDEKANHYMNDSYNFYLFPRGRPGPERMFLCQSSSLDFLAAQGFDFNKLIREGISYMTEPTETRLRESLMERQKLYSNEKDKIIIPEENKQHIEDICKKVRQFLDEKKADDMEIDKCNAFIRRLLFQELSIRFKNEVFVETKVLENKNRVLKVTRITTDSDGKIKDTQKKEKEWEEFEEAVGFSKVARMISQSEKLVIGHNMVLDLLHTLSHFFQPLPADYESFKEFANCMFPRILDTKYMSSLPPFKDKVNSSVLSHLFATLTEAPFSIPKAEAAAGRGYSRADHRPHEAGYDAYVTGLCFLAMHAHLAAMRGERAERVRAPPSALLRPFLNKLYLARTAHQDSPYINLLGDDPTPSRDHVFYLTFPKDWQRNEINQLFSPFGPITVQFLDDTSAFVALSRREQARDAARALAAAPRCTLVPYAKYKLAKAQVQQEKSKRSEEAVSITARTTPDRTARASIGNFGTTTSERIPVKVERNRSISASISTSASSPLQPSRKRTSSGVFQVDDAEPPTKKSEPARTYSEVTRMSAGDARAAPDSEVPNGLRKTAEIAEVEPSARTQSPVPLKKKVIERFEKSGSVAKCVAAFKESDSWD